MTVSGCLGRGSCHGRNFIKIQRSFRRPVLALYITDIQHRPAAVFVVANHLYAFWLKSIHVKKMLFDHV